MRNYIIPKIVKQLKILYKKEILIPVSYNFQKTSTI